MSGDPRYRAGFEDALRWVLEVFNLDTEDHDELNRVLEGGYCEGFQEDPDSDVARGDTHQKN